MLKQTVSALAVFVSTAVMALEPVTGSWVDSSNVQARTGYSIEVQNNFMAMSIYTYGQNNASTDPTWYNAGGFLQQNLNGTASGTFTLYNVANNQINGNNANVNAGSMHIVFSNPETAEITWTDFPGHKPGKTTIKKFWFLGTGTSAEQKRLAALGTWHYAGLSSSGQLPSLLVRYHNPSQYPKRDHNILLGTTDDRNQNVVKIFSEDSDLTLIRTANADIYYKAQSGGAEYATGVAAVVKHNAKPTDKDYHYVASAVRHSSRDLRDEKIIYKSLSLLDDSAIDTLIELAKAAMPQQQTTGHTK